MLALNPRQRIRKSNRTGLIAFIGSLLLPLIHGGIIDDHYGKGQAKQPSNDENADIICVMELTKLNRKEFLLIRCKRLAVSRAIHIAGDFCHDLTLLTFIHSTCHCHGIQNNESEQGNPDKDRFTKSPVMILSNHKMEIDQTNNRPDSHEYIGFCLYGMV